jgi:hypothetical protein
LLNPADPQPCDPQATYEDGPVVAANALLVELRRETFDRDRGEKNVEFAFSVLDAWLTRMRMIMHAADVAPVRRQGTRWLLQYLNDDGSLAWPERGDAFCAPHELVAVNLSPEMWASAAECQPIGDATIAATNLLLDARTMSHHVGASIVLAFTALEVRVESALDVLAKRKDADPQLWRWINERNGRTARPSTEEQRGILLDIVGQRSLKTEPRLWEAFKNLRAARNSFVHGGVPLIGKTPVNESTAFELIGLAFEILTWIETQLPSEDRRPPNIEVTGFKHTMTV